MTNDRCEARVEIRNQRGLHARASQKFVVLVSELPSGVRVEVEKDGEVVDGFSIMDLLQLGAAKGDSIVIRTFGAGAGDALARLVALVDDKFGEA